MPDAHLHGERAEARWILYSSVYDFGKRCLLIEELALIRGITERDF